MIKNLLVGLHKDQNNRFDPYLQIYEHILAHNGIGHLRLEASQSDFWKLVAELDLIIFHWVYIDRDQQMAEALIPIIEKEMGNKCFPDWSTFWHYNNKIKQYYLLKSHNFPVIESYPFWDKGIAEEWIAKITYPVVFKLNRGALSEDVILIHNKQEASRLVTLMFDKGISPGKLSQLYHASLLAGVKKIRKFTYTSKQKILGKYIDLWWQKEKNYVFFQKFLQGNQFTTRITVIGDRAFGFNIKTVEGDFRARDMQHIDHDKGALDIECVKIAFKISNTLAFQCMAYDFLFDENNMPLVCEMGYTSQANDIYKCPGYWDSSLNWHEGHYWPQYCQLIDLLNSPELKQPAIDFGSLR